MNGKKPVWLRIGILAACFCIGLAVTVGVSYLVSFIQDKVNIGEGDMTTEVTATKLSFEAKVREVRDDALIVEPSEGTPEREQTESIAIRIEDLADLPTIEYVKRAQAGDVVTVCYLEEGSDLSAGRILVYTLLPSEDNA